MSCPQLADHCNTITRKLVLTGFFQSIYIHLTYKEKISRSLLSNVVLVPRLVSLGLFAFVDLHILLIIEIRPRTLCDKSLVHGVLKFSDPSFSGFNSRGQMCFLHLLTL